MPLRNIGFFNIPAPLFIQNIITVLRCCSNWDATDGIHTTDGSGYHDLHRTGKSTMYYANAWNLFTITWR